MASWPQKLVRRHSLILYESAELALAAWWTLGAAIPVLQCLSYTQLCTQITNKTALLIGCVNFSFDLSTNRRLQYKATSETCEMIM